MIKKSSEKISLILSLSLSKNLKAKLDFLSNTGEPRHRGSLPWCFFLSFFFLFLKACQLISLVSLKGPRRLEQPPVWWSPRPLSRTLWSLSIEIQERRRSTRGRTRKMWRGSWKRHRRCSLFVFSVGFFCSSVPEVWPPESNRWRPDALHPVPPSLPPCLALWLPMTTCITSRVRVKGLSR